MLQIARRTGAWILPGQYLHLRRAILISRLLDRRGLHGTFDPRHIVYAFLGEKDPLLVRNPVWGTCVQEWADAHPVPRETKRPRNSRPLIDMFQTFKGCTHSPSFRVHVERLAVLSRATDVSQLIQWGLVMSKDLCGFYDTLRAAPDSTLLPTLPLLALLRKYATAFEPTCRVHLATLQTLLRTPAEHQMAGSGAGLGSRGALIHAFDNIFGDPALGAKLSTTLTLVRDSTSPHITLMSMWASLSVLIQGIGEAQHMCLFCGTRQTLDQMGTSTESFTLKRKRDEDPASELERAIALSLLPQGSASTCFQHTCNSCYEPLTSTCVCVGK
jgi:hypothetical protein